MHPKIVLGDITRPAAHLIDLLLSSGDDADALAIVSALVVDAGFDPVVVGPLARAREFDQGSPVYVTNMTAAQLREALGLR